MHITISTSSHKIFNQLENQILSQEKSKRYTSANDFIEHLFDVSRILDNGNTTLDAHNDWCYTPNTQRHVRIISRASRYHRMFELDDSIFLYP